MLASVLIHSQMAAGHGKGGSLCRPGCTILVRPLQDCQMAPMGCKGAGALAPGRATLPKPLDYCQPAS